MQLPKFKGWRRLWAIVSMYYFIPAALPTSFVGYYDGVAQAASRLPAVEW
jgi:hypothetical protein